MRAPAYKGGGGSIFGIFGRTYYVNGPLGEEKEKEKRS